MMLYSVQNVRWSQVYVQGVTKGLARCIHMKPQYKTNISDTGYIFAAVHGLGMEYM